LAYEICGFPRDSGAAWIKEFVAKQVVPYIEFNASGRCARLRR
jgi:hypothetical protein